MPGDKAERKTPQSLVKCPRCGAERWQYWPALRRALATGKFTGRCGACAQRGRRPRVLGLNTSSGAANSSTQVSGRARAVVVATGR